MGSIRRKSAWILCAATFTIIEMEGHMLNQFQINRERAQLQDLRAWATRAPISGLLIFGPVFFGKTVLTTLVLTILCLSAIGFSIYLLRSLIQLGKKGWVIAYAVVIGVPFLVLLMPDEADMAIYTLWFIPLVLFYVYCWVLRYAISEWLSDLGDEHAFIPEKKSDEHYEDFFRIR